MIAVLAHLAIAGSGYPNAIAHATGQKEGSTWKAVSTLYRAGWLELVDTPDPEGPRGYRTNYQLSKRGWLELPQVLLPTGQWTDQMRACWEQALGLTTSKLT